MPAFFVTSQQRMRHEGYRQFRSRHHDNASLQIYAAVLLLAIGDEPGDELLTISGQRSSGRSAWALDTHIQEYFCDPHHPWQRGSNENTNGLLRQYFPKGLDLSTYSQENLDEVARRLNELPRKTLDYQTPAQRFHECVASTD
jgi:hypothetical protein